MKMVHVLENHDIIQPNDIVRDWFKLNEFIQSDYDDETSLYWHLARDHIPAHVGHTLSSYQHLILIVRIDGIIPAGFRMAKRPSKEIQEIYNRIMKRNGVKL